jgi:hypothetical protein
MRQLLQGCGQLQSRVDWSRKDMTADKSTSYKQVTASLMLFAGKQNMLSFLTPVAIMLLPK